DDIDVTKNTIYIDRNTVSLAIDATKLNHLGVAWSLTVKTTTGSCYVQARVISSLTVLPGFTSSGSDFVADSPFSARDNICGEGAPNQFGECVCPTGYSGEYCDKPTCKNGGTRSMSICVCRTGYYGQLCESSVFPLPSTSPPTVPTTTVAPEASTNKAHVFYYLFIVIFSVALSLF
ncbi:hypothetical protein OSTOST_14826, partial [Ostertagia ostertagi]